MQAIRDWGRRHPDELSALLDENPSYVFFREVPAPAPGSLEAAIDGPIGTLGVPLAAGRTVAVDPRSIPLGAPVFLATTYPLSSRRRSCGSASPRTRARAIHGGFAPITSGASATKRVGKLADAPASAAWILAQGRGTAHSCRS
jgi:hypothetical protein